MFSSRPMQSLSKMRTIQFTTIQFGPVRSHVSGYFLQRKFFPSFFEGIRFRTWGIRIVFTPFFLRERTGTRLPADVLWGSFVTHSFRGGEMNAWQRNPKGRLRGGLDWQKVLRPTSFLAGRDYKRGLCYLSLIKRPVKNPHHLWCRNVMRSRWCAVKCKDQSKC